MSFIAVSRRCQLSCWQTDTQEAAARSDQLTSRVISETGMPNHGPSGDALLRGIPGNGDHSLLTSPSAPLINGPPSCSGDTLNTLSQPPSVVHHLTQTCALATSISPLLRTSQNLCLHRCSISASSTRLIDSAVIDSHSSRAGIGKNGNESINVITSVAFSVNDNWSFVSARPASNGRLPADALLI